MTIFRPELKTTLLLNTYTSVIVMPHTYHQKYLLETFSVRQLQFPNATGQVLCHSLTFCINCALMTTFRDCKLFSSVSVSVVHYVSNRFTFFSPTLYCTITNINQKLMY